MHGIMYSIDKCKNIKKEGEVKKEALLFSIGIKTIQLTAFLLE